MEHDYFIFYRSFYEALRDLPRDIQLEVLTAIIEYSLDGINPTDLKPVAKGMFALMKPVIDGYRTRVENGKKNARKRKKPEPDIYNMSFEQEVRRMKADKDWISVICHDFNISPGELDQRFVSFLDYCKRKRKNNPHDSFEDAQSHLRYWMAKAYQPQEHDRQPDNPTPPDYSYNGGFGGLDV